MLARLLSCRIPRGELRVPCIGPSNTIVIPWDCCGADFSNV